MAFFDVRWISVECPMVAMPDGNVMVQTVSGTWWTSLEMTWWWSVVLYMHFNITVVVSSWMGGTWWCLGNKRHGADLFPHPFLHVFSCKLCDDVGALWGLMVQLVMHGGVLLSGPGGAALIFIKTAGFCVACGWTDKYMNSNQEKWKPRIFYTISNLFVIYSSLPFCVFLDDPG